MIVSPERYRTLTRDQWTPDDELTDALTEAQAWFEDECEREFELAERTERVPAGRIWLYPKAYPILHVSGAADLAGDEDMYAIRSLSGQTEITYTGGYAPEDTPRGVVMAIVELTQRVLAPADTVTVPAGASSVSFPGLSVSGPALGGLSMMPIGIANAVRTWRHIESKLP